MKFWDSSALVPLVVDETSSPWARQQMRADRVAIIWGLSSVEIRSALARRHREKALDTPDFRESRKQAEQLFERVTQMVAFEIARDRALRLLDLHDLRAADALQLAAALVASDERPASLPFVTLDQRLAEAAEREGFAVVTIS
jgi:predicted nucleic acid-binding protein